MVVHYSPRAITGCGLFCTPRITTRNPKKTTCKKCKKSDVFKKDYYALLNEELNSELRVKEKIKEMDGSNG